MNEENKEKGQELENVSDQQLKTELEKRTEEKWEAKGKQIEEKINALEKKMPRPVNSFFDALCISVAIFVIAWIIKKLNWIGQMPGWSVLGIIFGALFAISLVYRLLIKSCKSKK